MDSSLKWSESGIHASLAGRHLKITAIAQHAVEFVPTSSKSWSRSVPAQAVAPQPRAPRLCPARYNSLRFSICARRPFAQGPC